MARYEYRSRNMEFRQYFYDSTGSLQDYIEFVCNEWANEGFMVFSVHGPSQGYFRLTARRDKEASFTPNLFEETP